MWWMLSMTALAGPPEVSLDWKKDASTLAVSPPVGQTIAEDAPADLSVRWNDREVTLAGFGSALTEGIVLGDVRGAAVEGSLEVSLCDKDSGVCRMTTWDLEARVPDMKKGAMLLRATEPAPPEEPEHTDGHSPFGADATAAAADAAFAAAKADGKPVLLDFSAVWCPPCNLLSAEVLHAEPLPAELEGWHVAVLDVDHASSWTLKDRYDVGGYPTVVAVDAEGTELSRVSGYPGRRAFLDWLATAASSPDATDLAKAPADVGVARAAELAWKLVQAYEHEAAEPWVERASEDEDRVVFRMARLGLEPTAEDATWLLDHGLDRITEWGGLTLDLAEDHPDLVRRVLDASLPVTDGPDVADVFWAYAQLEDDEGAQRRWYAAAAASLRAALSGDPAHDRAYYTWLARLMELSGDTEGALAFLASQSERFETDPTFDMSAASMLVRAERWDEALTLTESALENAWGDNRLRAATTRTKALVALDRTDEAEALVEETLAAVPAPEGELDVRTPRYRELLEEALAPDDDDDEG